MQKKNVMCQKITLKIKRNIIAFWLTHCYLPRIAQKYPDIFIKEIKSAGVGEKAVKVMKARYIDELSFKEIPEIVFVEERQVFKLHQKVIDKIISL